MVTLSDIKREHQDAIDAINRLSDRLAEEKVHTERSRLIKELHYWDSVQDYVLNKYKSMENTDSKYIIR
ncbi:MAG: hypothetical protein ABFQ64_06700 [Campylobacterota bacterium]